MTRIIYFAIMLLMPTVAFSGFFALDDASYRESICESTAQDITQFTNKKYYLDSYLKVGILPKDQKQEWAENYVTTVALIEDWKKEFAENCK